MKTSELLPLSRGSSEIPDDTLLCDRPCPSLMVAASSNCDWLSLLNPRMLFEKLTPREPILGLPLRLSGPGSSSVGVCGGEATVLALNTGGGVSGRRKSSNSGRTDVAAVVLSNSSGCLCATSGRHRGDWLARTSRPSGDSSDQTLPCHLCSARTLSPKSHCVNFFGSAGGGIGRGAEMDRKDEALRPRVGLILLAVSVRPTVRDVI